MKMHALFFTSYNALIEKLKLRIKLFRNRPKKEVRRKSRADVGMPTSEEEEEDDEESDESEKTKKQNDDSSGR